jgi:hypothetical protein
MTDREAEYWDDYYTKNTIMPDLSKPGYFARKYSMSVKLDPETSRVIATHAEATNKTPAEIIVEWYAGKWPWGRQAGRVGAPAAGSRPGEPFYPHGEGPAPVLGLDLSGNIRF